MIVVAGLSIKNLHPRVWDHTSPYYLPHLRAVMVSYGEFHQMPAKRKQAMSLGLRAYLGVPKHIQIYLDNGAFYFLRNSGEVERKHYRDFVVATKPDWYPIPVDFIPTPQMDDDEQRRCFRRTMEVNKRYHKGDHVPVIHISRILDEYIDGIKANKNLSKKSHIALGGIVPNLLRMPKAISYGDILHSLERVRTEFSKKKVHVFGIGGTATLHLAKLLRIDSVDSSGWRNRAARGIIQLPGCGDRSVSQLGSWSGRALEDHEWTVLKNCKCPACSRFGIDGLRQSGLSGFCNRAAHNLHILLEEARWLDARFAAKTYPRTYKRRICNTVYLPIIEQLVADIF